GGQASGLVSARDRLEHWPAALGTVPAPNIHLAVGDESEAVDAVAEPVSNEISRRPGVLGAGGAEDTDAAPFADPIGVAPADLPYPVDERFWQRYLIAKRPPWVLLDGGEVRVVVVNHYRWCDHSSE